MKIKITYDRAGCIGAAACAAVAPEFWKIVDDGLANLIGGKDLGEDMWELEINEDEFKEKFKEILQINKEAAEACPVQVIKIFNVDSGEQII